jgi:hypothetical protein
VTNAAFEKLNLRRKGGGSYYILGHLLNQRLGGTGADWKNLTPLSRKANAQHEISIERAVKKAVLGKGKKTVRYEVFAVYGRSPNAKLLAALAADDPVRVVVEEGAHVPSKLTIRAQDVIPGGTPTLNETLEVKNEIEEGSPSDYQVGGKPRLRSIGINQAIAAGDVEVLLRLKHIGKARAREMLSQTSGFRSAEELHQRIKGLPSDILGVWRAGNSGPPATLDGETVWEKAS